MTERFAVCYMRDPARVETTDALGILFVDAETMLDALEIAAAFIPEELGESIGTLFSATPLDNIKSISAPEQKKD